MQDWERNWRGGGVVFVVLIIVASFVYGAQPKLGASPADLLSFFHGDRTRILIATVIFCFAFLELLWFGAALSSVLRDAGFAGWGAAATASSAALGAILFFRMAVRAGLALSIADLGHLQVTSGLADLAFALTVISCFPAAMFVMSGAFGLSRAGIISKRFFSAGVAAVGLLGARRCLCAHRADRPARLDRGAQRVPRHAEPLHCARRRGQVTLNVPVISGCTVQ
jgi:hypothetical protein